MIIYNELYIIDFPLKDVMKKHVFFLFSMVTCNIMLGSSTPKLNITEKPTFNTVKLDNSFMNYRALKPLLKSCTTLSHTTCNQLEKEIGKITDYCLKHILPTVYKQQRLISQYDTYTQLKNEYQTILHEYNTCLQSEIEPDIYAMQDLRQTIEQRADIIVEYEQLYSQQHEWEKQLLQATGTLDAIVTATRKQIMDYNSTNATKQAPPSIPRLPIISIPSAQHFIMTTKNK